MRKTKIMDWIGLAIPKSPLSAIVWRELLDAFRDRRTILAAVVLPMILIPVTLNLPVFFMSPKQNPPTVAVVQLDPTSGILTNGFNSTGALKVSLISSSENFTNLVINNIYDLIVIIPANFSQSIIANKTAILQVIYDSSNQRSSTGLSIVQAVEIQYSNAIVNQRLSDLHIDPSILNPIILKPESVRIVSPSQAIAGYLIPYFIGVLSIAAGASFATDTTAGEKERRTLEVFLTQPITRRQIIFGKYLGVFLLSLIGIGCQVIGVVMGFNIYESLFAEMIGQAPQGLSFSLISILTIGGFALILSMTGNAILMAVSIFAKSFKEAQQYSSALMTALIIPMIAVIYLPPSILSRLVFLPLIGPVVILRNVIFNIWAIDQLLVCLASSIIFLVIVLYLATRIFSREKAIFRV
jgi:sodium transport system permease protein